MSLLSDLSVSGLYVLTPSPAPVGETLALMFESPGKAIKARGTVRRSDPGRGMGVEFVEMSEDDRRRVVSLLQATLKQGFALRNPDAAKPVASAPAATAPGDKGQMAAALSASAEKAGIFTEEELDITEELASAAEESTEAPAKRKAQPEPEIAFVMDEPAPILRPHTPPSGRSPSERRGQVRLIIPATAEIKIPTSGESFRAAVGNIGRQGCYIKTERNLPTGTDVLLHIIKGKFAFSAGARVVHSFTGKGFGLMFTAVEPANMATFEAWLQSSQELSWWNESRRRSQRLTLAVAVTVSLKNAAGKVQAEKTTTVSISPQGASVLLMMKLEAGQLVDLFNPRTRATAECRVVYKGNRQEDKWLVGLAFSLPNREFWKVAFPPSDWSVNHPEAKQQSEPTPA